MEVDSRLFKVKWKTTTCKQGESCWCRGISPVEEILDEEEEPLIIESTGNITKEIAEYLVELHNNKINGSKCY